MGGTGVDTVVGGPVGERYVTVGEAGATTVVAGRAGSRANDVEPVTVTVTPETVNKYLSGFHVEVSAVKAQWFRPFVPGTTLTIPEAPENSPDWLFLVGWKDSE